MALNGSPSRPAFARPAPWIVAKRIRGRFAASERPVPDDFETVFVSIGRIDCEEHFRVSRATINRWLDHAGKYRLLELRREVIRLRDSEARIGRAKAAQVREIEVETVAALAIPHPALVALAADYLRKVSNGGWHISRTKHGDWWVGTVCRNSASLIAMAERHGFDSFAANLQVEADHRLRCGR